MPLILPPHTHTFTVRSPTSRLGNPTGNPLLGLLYKGSKNTKRRRVSAGLYFDKKHNHKDLAVCHRIYRPLSPRPNSAARTFGLEKKQKTYRLRRQRKKEKINTNARNKEMKIYLDAGGSVSSDSGWITRYPATYSSKSGEIPEVQPLQMTDIILSYTRIPSDEQPQSRLQPPPQPPPPPPPPQQSQSQLQQYSQPQRPPQQLQQQSTPYNNRIKLHRSNRINASKQLLISEKEKQQTTFCIDWSTKDEGQQIPPISRYNQHYCCTIIRIESHVLTKKLDVYYSCRGNKSLGVLPFPKESILIDAKGIEHHSLYHTELLSENISKKYQLLEGILTFPFISLNINDDDNNNPCDDQIKSNFPLPNILPGIPALTTFVFGGRPQWCSNNNICGGKVWSEAALRVPKMRKKQHQKHFNSSTACGRAKRKPKLWKTKRPQSAAVEKVDRDTNTHLKPVRPSTTSRIKQANRRAARRGAIIEKEKNEKIEKERQMIGVRGPIWIEDKNYDIRKRRREKNKYPIYMKPKTTGKPIIHVGLAGVGRIVAPITTPWLLNDELDNSDDNDDATNISIDDVTNYSIDDVNFSIDDDIDSKESIITTTSEVYYKENNLIQRYTNVFIKKMIADSTRTFVVPMFERPPVQIINLQFDVLKKEEKNKEEEQIMVNDETSSTNERNKIIKNEEHQIVNKVNDEHQNTTYSPVIYLDSWIKKAVEEETRRKIIIENHSTDVEKKIRIQKLYAVDREKVVDKLTSTLPSILGELIWDLEI